MYDDDPQNDGDRWTVSAKLLETARPIGAAHVEITLENGVIGRLPPFVVTVDWRDGMDASDVVAYALQLACQSAGFLSSQLVRAGMAVQKRGE